jgi:hypothetical protein
MPKNRKRNLTLPGKRPGTKIEFVNVKRPIAMCVDAAYFFVLMEDGKLNIGSRGGVGIEWSEGEPVPGTLRAAEINAIRENMKAEAARLEAQNKK